MTTRTWALAVLLSLLSGSHSINFTCACRLPASMLVQSGSFYLEAHPVGSNEVYRSDPILVNPGNRVIWSLENQLSLSSYRIASGK